MIPTQVIQVPENPKLATEPALTYGDLFGNKTAIQQAIAAVIAILVMAGVKIPEGIDATLANSLFVLAPIVAMIYGGIVAKLNARKQAEATRDVVYAPESVATMAKAVKNGAPIEVQGRVVG